MTTIDVKIEGLEELLNDLKRKFPQEYERVVGQAMSKAVLDVEGWAKKNAPVDTGLLRASLFGTTYAPMGEIVGVVGTYVKYAPFVEEGGGRPRGVGRIPFLRPAVEEHEEDILTTFRKAVDNLVKAMEK